MSRKRRRGVTTAQPAGAPESNGHAPAASLAGRKPSQLPYVREERGGRTYVDGHEVLAVEPVRASDSNRALDTCEQLLLDDGRTLLGCRRCAAVGENVRSLGSHNRTHAARYADPRVRKEVERAVERVMTRAAERAAPFQPVPPPTPEDIAAVVAPEPTPEEAPAAPAGDPVASRIAAKLYATEPDPFPETGGVTPPSLGRVLAEAEQSAPAGPRTIVEIAEEIAKVTARLEELKAEMRAAVGL